jgi:Fe-S cluster assembly iron-binding protein IscA
MLAVTGKAAEQFREIMKREKVEDAAIRLYVSGVG